MGTKKMVAVTEAPTRSMSRTQDVSADQSSRILEIATYCSQCS